MTTPLKDRFVIGLDEADRSCVGLVGGKAANLGELARIDGVTVPDGFCVTVDAFDRHRAGAPSIEPLLERLAQLASADRQAVKAISAELRSAIEQAVVPEEAFVAITDAVLRLGGDAAYAVRSSASAEDLPAASFAGQHDSYLNVLGPHAVIQHVIRCWASLFTERAVIYRIEHGIDHGQVGMAVVVQRMLSPRAAGALFTADPLTSNRTVSSVEATFGLGEALVSGSVAADTYEVRGGHVRSSVAVKTTAVTPSPDGGVRTVPLASRLQQRAVLDDDLVLELAALGRTIEAHFGGPQDIEWCLVEDRFHVVQSRPITTLFPIPVAEDRANRVYLSVGHQQMMTDAMKPLGLSFWQKIAARPMTEAGGRLFVDVTAQLRSPAGREGVLNLAGRSDPLVRDALQTVLGRRDFVPLTEDDPSGAPAPWGGASVPLAADPEVVDELIDEWRSSNERLRCDIRSKSGVGLLDFIAADIGVLRGLLFAPRSLQVIMAAIDASWWLNEHVEEWWGERNVADVLTRSAPNNVTSEMGLALLDVADVIRGHPAVISHLEQRQATDVDILDGLANLPGGQEAREAIAGFLERYGVRCVGEIDITRPRWHERPAALIPLLVGHVRSQEPGEAQRRFEQGRRQAAAKEEEILGRLGASADGRSKARETKQMIDRVRTFIGYREYPKFGWMVRFDAYRQALLRETRSLADAGVVDDPRDTHYLTLDELHDAVRAGWVDAELVAERKKAHQSYETLSPPRVITSDGEALTGSYRRDDVPPGALAGLAVSAGIVEGRARVVSDMADADLEPGDILVTTHTDPSWSPLFVSISGLVTEVGGLMTHGAVVAREYGLPAVVGVEHATQRIADGQWIRLNGTNGYVQLEREGPAAGRSARR